MKKSILITDSLFINKTHEDALKEAGFEFERLDKPKASEEELKEHLRGKAGYILGGIEEVTDAVIQAADQLEVISFTGSGYTEFIPGHKFATERGIAISAAKGANALDTAEFTIGLIFEMVRNFPLLRTRNTEKGNSFFIARRIAGLTLGIIGYGRVGSQVARLGLALGMNVLVYSRRKPENLQTGIKYVPLSEILKSADIVSVHVDKLNGKGCLLREHLELLKAGTILVNISFPEAVDLIALKELVMSKRIKVAFDASPKDFPDGLPFGAFTYSNGQTAFNTVDANRITSDRATNSMINLLSGKDDVDLVNPEFKRNRAQIKNGVV